MEGSAPELRREVTVTDAIVVQSIDSLLEHIEAHYGFPVTEAPSQLEIVQEVDGRFKLYMGGRRHLRRQEE